MGVLRISGSRDSREREHTLRQRSARMPHPFRPRFHGRALRNDRRTPHARDQRRIVRSDTNCRGEEERREALGCRERARLRRVGCHAQIGCHAQERAGSKQNDDNNVPRKNGREAKRHSIKQNRQGEEGNARTRRIAQGKQSPYAVEASRSVPLNRRVRRRTRGEKRAPCTFMFKSLNIFGRRIV